MKTPDYMKDALNRFPYTINFPNNYKDFKELFIQVIKTSEHQKVQLLLRKLKTT